MVLVLMYLIVVNIEQPYLMSRHESFPSIVGSVEKI
jgi:hypothetical protein